VSVTNPHKLAAHITALTHSKVCVSMHSTDSQSHKPFSKSRTHVPAPDPQGAAWHAGTENCSRMVICGSCNDCQNNKTTHTIVAGVRRSSEHVVQLGRGCCCCCCCCGAKVPVALPSTHCSCHSH
jgi:hypothetical protein